MVGTLSHGITIALLRLMKCWVSLESLPFSDRMKDLKSSFCARFRSDFRSTQPTGLDGTVDIYVRRVRISRKVPNGLGTQPLLAHPMISLIAVRILRLYKVVLRRNEEILWS